MREVTQILFTWQITYLSGTANQEGNHIIKTIKVIKAVNDEVQSVQWALQESFIIQGPVYLKEQAFYVMLMITSLTSPPEVLSPSEHAAQLQRSEILEECEQGRNCCYTLKSVERVMKKVGKFHIANSKDTHQYKRLHVCTEASLLEFSTLPPPSFMVLLVPSVILDTRTKNIHPILQGIHCVLPLGLDCVRRLHRAEIFPIIIFIGQSARSARKLR